MTVAFTADTLIKSYFGSLVDLKTKCVDTFTLLSVMCITDFLIDLAILILPLPCIWQLNVKPKVKIGVSLVFLLAAFSVATSCARMVFMLKILSYRKWLSVSIQAIYCIY